MTKPDLEDLIVASRERRLAGAERPDQDPGLARIRRGYFRPHDVELTAEDHHQLRIVSTAAARRPGLIFSHASAAVLWGAPLLTADLADVHALQPGRARRTTAGVRVHPTRIPDDQVTELPSGLLVSSRDWTAIQVAAMLELPNVLLPLDHLVQSIARDAGACQGAVIDALLAVIPAGSRGRARAERNLRAVDVRSGSAGGVVEQRADDPSGGADAGSSGAVPPVRWARRRHR